MIDAEMLLDAVEIADLANNAGDSIIMLLKQLGITHKGMICFELT